MSTRLVAAAAVVTFTLNGCATEKPLNMQLLDQARAEVQSLSQNPAATAVAGREFTASRDALSQAERALDEKKQTEMDSHAYIAIRQAKTGQAQIAEQTARQRLVLLRNERERVALEARNAELEAQNRAQAQEASRGTVLTLSGVLFETGKATLLPGAEASLTRVSDYMNQYPRARLRIEGHTDSQGSEQLNQHLSFMRADSVAQALVLRGIAPDRIEAAGRGPDMPIASNGTAEGRQQNRRVEILFSDNAGRFAEGARRVTR